MDISENHLERGRQEMEDPPDESKLLLDEGRRLLDTGQPTRAIEYFARAIQVKPGDSKAKRGIDRSLRESSLVYRSLLNFTSWLGDLCVYSNRHVLFAILVHAYFHGQLGVRPMFKNLEHAVEFLTVLLVFLPFCSQELQRLVLMTSRYGRLTVGPFETLAAMLVGVSVAIAIGMVTVAYLNFPGNSASLDLASPPLMAGVMVAMTRAIRGWPRWVMGAYAIGFAIVIAVTSTKWVSHSIDAAKLDLAPANNPRANANAIAVLNERIAEVSDWLTFCGYCLLSGMVLFVILQRLWISQQMKKRRDEAT